MTESIPCNIVWRPLKDGLVVVTNEIKIKPVLQFVKLLFISFKLCVVYNMNILTEGANVFLKNKVRGLRTLA